MRKIVSIFLLLFITACSDSWKYEFISEIMKNPENIFSYAKENNIILDKSILKKLKDKDFFNNLLNDIKDLNSPSYGITIDEKYYSYSFDDNFKVKKSKKMKHRIKIYNKEKNKCINFYFNVSSNERILYNIKMGDNRFDPEDVEEHGECDQD
jgi:hypothetical protein